MTHITAHIHFASPHLLFSIYGHFLKRFANNSPGNPRRLQFISTDTIYHRGLYFTDIKSSNIVKDDEHNMTEVSKKSPQSSISQLHHHTKNRLKKCTVLINGSVLIVLVKYMLPYKLVEWTNES